jgi:hypothetical protein
MGNSTTQISMKTKNKMEGGLPDGCVAGPRNTRMEKTSWGYRRMKAFFEDGQGPDGGVVIN